MTNPSRFISAVTAFTVAASLWASTVQAQHFSEDPAGQSRPDANELLYRSVRDMVQTLKTRCGDIPSGENQECLNQVAAPHKDGNPAASAFARCASNGWDDANIGFYSWLWPKTLSPENISDALYARERALDQVTHTCQPLFPIKRPKPIVIEPSSLDVTIG